MLKRILLFLIILFTVAFSAGLPSSYNWSFDYYKIPANCWSQTPLQFRYEIDYDQVVGATNNSNGSMSGDPYAPQFTNITISPTSANETTPRLNISTIYTNPLGLTANLTLIWRTRTCHQESANVSTTCGGLATGSYALTAGFVSPENFSDGNVSTCGYPPLPTVKYYDVNYSKASGTTNETMVKVTTRMGRNPAGTDQNYQTVDLFCYNGSAWETIATTNFINGTYYQLCEESMLWDITTNLSVTTTNNVASGTTVSQNFTNFSVGQTIEFYVIAKDKNFTITKFSLNTVRIESTVSTGSGGGGGLPPPTDEEEVIITKSEEGDGGKIAQSIVDRSGGGISQLNYTCQNWFETKFGLWARLFDVVVCEWTGIQSLYITKIGGFVNMALVTLLTFVYIGMNTKNRNTKAFHIFILAGMITLVVSLDFLVFSATYILLKLSELTKIGK